MSDQGPAYSGPPIKPNIPSSTNDGLAWWQKLKAWLTWTVIALVVVMAIGMFVYDAVHDNMLHGYECTYWRFMTLRCL